MKVQIDGVDYAPISNKVDPVNFPKLQSPFVRADNEDGKYCVKPEVTEGFEWVFEDPEVIASEKIDGTGVSIVIEGGQITSVWNRTQPIPWDVLSAHRIVQGIRNAHTKGYFNLSQDGQFFGELMAPKVQGNFLELEEPRWFPFELLRRKFSFRTYHEHPKTFENISDWFKDFLPSRVAGKFNLEKKPEGIVFYQPSTGNMAKLRRDMFDWYHK